MTNLEQPDDFDRKRRMEEARNLTRGPQFQSERLVPDEADPGNLYFSLRRYEFARSYAKGKTVLDAGCGTGYGTDILASVGARVVGVDYDPGVIRYCKSRYRAENLAYLASAVTSLPFRDASFDVVVSFEVVEHLPDYASHGLFYREVKRVLTARGLFIISTSNRDVTIPHQSSVGITVDAHLTEMNLATFRKELEQEFAVDFLGGMRYRGNFMYGLLRFLDVFNLRLRLAPAVREFIARRLLGVNRQLASSDNVVIAPSQLRQAGHFLAICRSGRPE